MGSKPDGFGPFLFLILFMSPLIRSVFENSKILSIYIKLGKLFHFCLQCEKMTVCTFRFVRFNEHCLHFLSHSGFCATSPTGVKEPFEMDPRLF